MWHFGEDTFGKDSILVDSTGQHDGTATGSSITQPRVDTPLGRGLDMVTADETIQIQDQPSLAIADAITVEMFVRVTDLTPAYQEVIGRNGAWSARVLEAGGDGASFAVEFAKGSSITVRPPVPTTDEWMYIAGTYDAATGEVRACINGDVCDDQVTPGAGPLVVPTTPVVIGYVDATVDEIRISSVRRPNAWLEAMSRAVEGTLITPL